MEDNMMNNLQLIDFIQHLLDVNMELVLKAGTLRSHIGNDFQRRIDKIGAVIDDCIDELQAL